MKVERIKNDIIITLPASVDEEGAQDILNFARRQKLISKNKVDPGEFDKFAKKWLAKRNRDWLSESC